MVKITGKILKHQHNFWNNFHFHPTDAIEDAWGQVILDKAAADHVADTVRMYAMLEDIVTMDENGKLCYDFTENDVRMDYMLSRGYNLLISYNFIPKCISDNPVMSNTEVNVSTRYKGKMLVTMPPKDWGLWEEICYEYTKHIVERYGLDTVKNFYLQCFNEPDVRGFFMKPLGTGPEATEKRCEEYMKMYTAFEHGTRRVSDKLKIGGPTAASRHIFDLFLKYTSEHHLKVDYACAHSYGTNPQRINDGLCDIGVENNMKIMKGYIDTIHTYYPEGLEFVMDEWGASGAGFCNLNDCPKLIFRENEIFSAFYGRLITKCTMENIELSKLMICLSGSHQPHQLENHFPEFNGFRSYMTEHYITKPIYNAYVLARHLKETVCESESDNENLLVFPTTDGTDYDILLTYASADFKEDLPPITDTLKLPLSGNYRVTKWCIDRDHINPYRMWQKENMAAFPTAEQIKTLRAEGNLRPLETVTVTGDTEIPFTMSCNGLMLIEIVKF